MNSNSCNDSSLVTNDHIKECLCGKPTCGYADSDCDHGTGCSCNYQKHMYIDK